MYMATWSPSYLMMTWGYGGVVLIQTEGIYLIFIFLLHIFMLV